jgi:hypothetical protein
MGVKPRDELERVIGGLGVFAAIGIGACLLVGGAKSLQHSGETVVRIQTDVLYIPTEGGQTCRVVDQGRFVDTDGINRTGVKLEGIENRVQWWMTTESFGRMYRRED